MDLSPQDVTVFRVHSSTAVWSISHTSPNKEELWGRSLSQPCSINQLPCEHRKTHALLNSVQTLTVHKSCLLPLCIISLLSSDADSEGINRHDCAPKNHPHTHINTHSILTGLRLSMSESHVSMMRVSFGHEPNVHSFLSFETSVQRFCRAFNYNWCKTVLKWCAHREGLRNKRTKIKL